MRITASTVSLTVDDVATSHAFFTGHLGYQEPAAAEGHRPVRRVGHAGAH